jgi:hypothetical protein
VQGWSGGSKIRGSEEACVEGACAEEPEWRELGWMELGWMDFVYKSDGIAKEPIGMLLLQSSLNLCASFVFFRTLTRNSTEVFT